MGASCELTAEDRVVLRDRDRNIFLDRELPHADMGHCRSDGATGIVVLIEQFGCDDPGRLFEIQGRTIDGRSRARRG